MSTTSVFVPGGADFGSRTPESTCQPSAASTRATSRPMPRLAPVISAAPATMLIFAGTPRAPRRPPSPRSASRLNQRPRLLQILRLDRIQRLVGERAHGAGRVVAGVLREGARADDEEIGDVPALQVFVDDAGVGVRAHDGAAGVVRRLVG